MCNEIGAHDNSLAAFPCEKAGADMPMPKTSARRRQRPGFRKEHEFVPCSVRKRELCRIRGGQHVSIALVSEIARVVKLGTMEGFMGGHTIDEAKSHLCSTSL